MTRSLPSRPLVGNPPIGVGACSDFRRLDGMTMNRRHVLQAGGLGLLGLSLPQLWAAQSRAATAPPNTVAGFGKAKRCIFLFMWGGPSQLDTFDPKPLAPAEVRGPFKTISTRVSDIQISEHFARVSQLTDKLAIVRSLCHDDPAHLSSGHLTLTGHLAPTLKSDAAPPSERDTPHLGSMLARLRGGSSTLPSFVTLPWMALHPAAPGGRAPGQNGGWLGHKYDPLLVSGDPSKSDWRVQELSLLDGVSYDRIDSRRTLLGEIDRQRAELATSDVTGLKDRAFGLLTSANARSAFDLSQESDATRDRYGRNIHGQCVLLARRLVEQGVPLVSVNWHNDGKNFWDTHGHNFSRLKDDLIPPADRALSALLEDLDQRGLLDETIVAWVGEFGRNPRIEPGGGGGGRNHWPFCYSGLLAGGGIRGGAVYGRSDQHAARPAESPVSPQDYAATLLHALGIAPQTAVEDRFGRPNRVCEGRPMTSLFG